jgi:hypothetical protein
VWPRSTGARKRRQQSRRYLSFHVESFILFDEDYRTKSERRLEAIYHSPASRSRCEKSFETKGWGHLPENRRLRLAYIQIFFGDPVSGFPHGPLPIDLLLNSVVL